ncbi:hypothetical protein [Streptomyces coerulescens]|uniref:Uncharacterized protein n=1 Tax=Streptomyces coerulescens TaxID=29304 RepID=A0ABW0CLS1_STRCD
MSRRENGGPWVNTSHAADWLSQPRGQVRAFAFHLRMEGKLPGAWDYDPSMRPKTALDQQFIFDNWPEWAEAWSAWRSRVGK